MNLLAIGGSPRIDGNSNSLLRLAVEGARGRGATADILYASRLDVQGCDACDGCKNAMDVGCVVEDDMQQVYERLASCDALVLATPVYFYQMTSWLKTVLDRLYGLLGPEYEPRVARGKGFYVITAEAEERTYAGQEIAGTLMRGLAWLKMELRGELIAVELDGPDDWKGRPELVRAAGELIRVE